MRRDDIVAKIVQIRATAQEGNEADCMLLIKGLMNGMCYTGVTLKNEIFRARWNEPGKLFDKIKELIYPPPEIVDKKGRFNSINQSIFYGALSERATIMELRPKLQKLFTISRFSLCNEPPIFFTVGLDGQGYQPVYSNLEQKRVNDFLIEEVTRHAFIESDYNTSILLGRFFLHTPLVNSGIFNSSESGMVYPSIQSKIISEKQDYNIAIPPNFFENHYRFKDTTVYILTPRGNSWQLNPVNKAQANEEGALIWNYTFWEMHDRMSCGLCLDDTVCKEVALVAP